MLFPLAVPRREGCRVVSPGSTAAAQIAKMRHLLVPIVAGLSLAACVSPYGWSEAPLGDHYYGSGYGSGAPVGWWGSDAVSVDVFYAPLSRYGRWDAHPRYGRVFVPAIGPQGWQPYSRGYWRQDPRYGRMWVSSEPFGWATYHYGRWGRDPGIGWYWVPDVRFGASWVDWRYVGGAGAWAPLPPYGWDPYASRNDWWLWAPGNRLWSPGLDRYARPGRPPHDRDQNDDRPGRDRSTMEVARPFLPKQPGSGVTPSLTTPPPVQAWQGGRRPPESASVETSRHPRSAPVAGFVREANAVPRADPAARPAPSPQARQPVRQEPVQRQAAARPAPSRTAEPATREKDR